ncbi:MAG: class I SAM-dependent methyltransferase [Alphaproteobacteria bacterium]|nr:class I SAM-dependent methyltransferase [Alphaproteobacteria bacterium]
MTVAARLLLNALDRWSSGKLTLRLPDGTERDFGIDGTAGHAFLEVRDWRFFRRVLLDGDIGFAESYIEGLCDSPDLPVLIALLADNEKALGDIAVPNTLHSLVLRFLHRRRRNSRRGAKKNIHAHYDLGNEFYRLWLDPSMTYSSALYDGNEGKPLDAAQAAKYDRILEQIGAKQGDTILEIGCGWGGFAETAARRGMRVTGVTISQRQLDYARDRLAQAGLADRVDLQFRDYRDLEGQYDHIVSIEMVEAVGERYWPDYFATLRRHIVPGGSILVQAIVIADEFFDRYRRHPDFIQSYVFPGGMLLSPANLRQQCRQAGLKIAELYSFGMDYARTLETWLGRFDRVADQVAKLGFDDRFRRMWRYYLAYCAAGFATRRTDVLQAHFRPI